MQHDERMPGDERARQLSLGDGRTVAVYNVPGLESDASPASGNRPRLSLFNVGLACCALEVAAAAADRSDERPDPPRGAHGALLGRRPARPTSWWSAAP